MKKLNQKINPGNRHKGVGVKTILELLQDKNFHLEKFYRLNEAEIENIEAGQFDALDTFYNTREGLLDVVKKIDEMIEDDNTTADVQAEINDQIKFQVLQALQYKNELVGRILEQDLRILSAIEHAKTSIIKQLTQVRAARKVIGTHGEMKTKVGVSEEA